MTSETSRPSTTAPPLPPPSYPSATTANSAKSGRDRDIAVSVEVSQDVSPPRYVPPRPIPTVNILLLGSPDVGKSTFVSKLPYIRNGKLQTPTQSSATSASASSFSSIPESLAAPANPAQFNVTLFNRPYTMNIHRNTSPLFIDPFPDKIDVLVLCYAVDDRASLVNVNGYWRRVFAEKYESSSAVLGSASTATGGQGRGEYNTKGEIPVLLLGLKRDLRTDAKQSVTTPGSGDNGTVEHRYVCVTPDEGMKVAADVRADRYAECSSVTGELMWEVLEDLTRMAALTTTEKGGASDGGCIVM